MRQTPGSGSPTRGRGLSAAAVLLGLVATSDRAAAGPPTIGPFDVPTVFYIDKSQNRNRVDFGVRLDASCQPVGANPVFAYWREFERAPLRLSNLTAPERGVYGVDKQRVVDSKEGGAELVVRLKKLDREVVIVTNRAEDGHCESTARTRIAGVADAVLRSAHVQLSSPLVVKYVEIRGEDPRTAEALVERVTP